MNASSIKTPRLSKSIVVPTILAIILLALASNLIIKPVTKEINFYRTVIGSVGPGRDIRDLIEAEYIEFHKQPELFYDNQRTQKLASLLLVGVLKESPVFLKISHIEHYVELDKVYKTSGADSLIWDLLGENLADAYTQNKESWADQLYSVSQEIKEYEKMNWRAQAYDYLIMLFALKKSRMPQLNASVQEIVENAQTSLSEIQFPKQTVEL